MRLISKYQPKEERWNTRPLRVILHQQERYLKNLETLEGK